MSTKSTREIAAEVGIGKMTLERWLREGKIKRPKILKFGGRNFRIWTRHNIEEIKRYKKLHLYEGRGRKKGSGNEDKNSVSR